MGQAKTAEVITLKPKKPVHTILSALARKRRTLALYEYAIAAAQDELRTPQMTVFTSKRLTKYLKSWDKQKLKHQEDHKKLLRQYHDMQAADLLSILKE